MFDIDGTILNCHGAGKKSLMEACHEVFSTTGIMDEVNFQGKTDPIILYESLRHMGYSEHDIKKNSYQLKTTYFHFLQKNISKDNTTIFPGVIELLESLNINEHVIIGLLTGNYQESAAIKLETYQLNGYFSVGAYGDDAATRNGLPPVARQRIQDTFNRDLDFTDMVIIGDTVYDIECAHYSGARSLIVGTGWTDRETLLAHKPHFYFDDLSNTEKVLEALSS